MMAYSLELIFGTTLANLGYAFNTPGIKQDFLTVFAPTYR
jgi:hypothetical protein